MPETNANKYLIERRECMEAATTVNSESRRLSHSRHIYILHFTALLHYTAAWNSEYEIVAAEDLYAGIYEHRVGGGGVALSSPGKPGGGRGHRHGNDTPQDWMAGIAITTIMISALMRVTRCSRRGRKSYRCSAGFASGVST